MKQLFLTILLLGLLGCSEGQPEQSKEELNKVFKQIKYQPLVYLIYDGNYLKIGKTKNIKSRFSALQTGNPNKLYLSGYILCKTSKEAFKVERTLHKKFKKYHKHGEWYDIKIEDIKSSKFNIILP